VITDSDMRALGAATANVIRESSATLLARIKELEGEIRTLRSTPAPVRGEQGEKGETGERGADGHSPSEDELKALIAPLIPAPIPGEKGADGRDGRDGVDGKDGRTPTVEEIKALIPEPIAGEQGPPGRDGRDGEPGSSGRDGIDGKSITVDDVLPLLDGYFAKWALAAEQRIGDVIHRSLDRIEKPKDGQDGKDGRDAFDLEHLFVSMGEDDRTLTFGFVRGEERIERSIVLAHQVYRGVWTKKDYQRGDVVSFGGSQFVAMRDTDSKPETDDSWRLAVKRGRDGKDGRDLSPPPHRVVQA